MSEPTVEKREQAVQVLGELMRLMDMKARLEAKDAADGGIAVALHLDGDFPGIQAGRRSHVVDSLQFIANKVVNRAGTDKRWIAVGLGAFPEPRSARSAPNPAPAPAGAVLAPAAAPGPRPAPPAHSHASHAPSRSAPLDEGALTPAEDSVVSALGALLAKKAGTLGWFYAVAPMQADDRARMFQAAQSVPGQRTFAEGEARNRRLVFAPEKPAALPKRSALPVDDDEEPGA